MPPAASPFTSIANWVSGSAAEASVTQPSAASRVYGWGKRSRTWSQIFRLLAWWASDGASPTCQLRMRPPVKSSCILPGTGRVGRRELVACRGAEDQVEGEKQGLGERKEHERRQDHQRDSAVLEQGPWRGGPGEHDRADEQRGEQQLGRHDVEHVRADLVPLVSALGLEPADGAALAHAEPRSEQPAPPAVGAAEPKGACEEHERAGEQAGHG